MSFNLQSMNNSFSDKMPQNGCNLDKMKNYFLHSYSMYQKLFCFIKEDKSYFLKSEPLRHPLIFYYGHTACFYINKLLEKGLICNRVNPKFESIFAVGVDEMDWDDLDEAHYTWPTVEQVTSYRQKVKEVVLAVLDKINPNMSWDSDAWALMMGVEHQRVHFQTSAVIIRRLPIQQIRPSIDLIDCPLYRIKVQETPKNEMKTVPSYKFEWDRQIKTARVYGWDNQFGQKTIDTKAYKSSTMLVSNGEYLEFVQDKGYQKLQFWDEEGKAWLKSIKSKIPLFWGQSNGKYTLRTMSKVMPLPMDWPVEVCNLEATAFCNWKSKKVSKNYRLPTEDQYFALRALLKKDLDWEYGEIGNINMEYWFSPNPVNYFKTGQFYDIVGNVWQHCSNPIYPFRNFQIHPLYEDFSTPFFDGQHYMIKGGSFASIGGWALVYIREAFRRHFYQFTGFRYVESENSALTQQIMDQSDKTVAQFLQVHYLTPQSYPMKVCQIVDKYCKNVNQKCLTVGCSVGRIALQISKHFLFSEGVDYSARFFQMATRLYEKGSLKYKALNISTESLKIDRQKVVLYLMNLENPDLKKLHGFSVAIFDGLSIRDERMTKVIKSMKEALCQKAKIIIISTQSRNSVSEEDLTKIFSKVQQIANQVVSEHEAQNFSVQVRLFEVESLPHNI